MSVDPDTVRRIAQLARIAVAEDEIEHLRVELNAILAFVEQLSEVDVEGVEPMTSVIPMEMRSGRTSPPTAAFPMPSSRMRRWRRNISSSYRRWWNNSPRGLSHHARASAVNPSMSRG